MSDLEQAVFAFSRLTAGLNDNDLELPWEWGDYSEGVRFSFFRTLEDLNLLSANLTIERNRIQPFSTAQRLLGQYHSAYRDLQAILLGVSDLQAEQAPAEGEWPLRSALLHIVEAERAFFAITAYSIESERANDGRPLEMSDEAWESFWVGDTFRQLKEAGSFSEILAYYDLLHLRILTALEGITEAELDAPVVFWERQPMPVRFRLGRFTSHLRQHTIQMEKSLPLLNLMPNEARRLLRLIYQALAEVEGCTFGAPELATACLHLAEALAARTAEIAIALAGPFSAETR